MTEVLFGVTLPQFTGDVSAFASSVKRAEDLGLDSLWVFDHLWPLSGGKERSILEGWTSLAWLAGATKDIGIGTLVTRSSLRHPALLAKMAATVNGVAAGRLTVALGSGDEMSRDENEAYGIPYYAGDERIDQLTSAARALTDLLAGEEVTQKDEHVELSGLRISPSPTPRPTVWVAGRSDDALEVAGACADGWNGWGGSPERFAQDALRVAEFASASGGRTVELTWGGLAVIGEDDAAARAKLGDRNPSEYLVGGPDTIARRLEQFIEAGARHVILTFSEAGKPGSYELFAERVKPLLGLA